MKTTAAISAVLFSAFAGEVLGGASAEFHARYGHAGSAIARHRRHRTRSDLVQNTYSTPSLSKRKCKTKNKKKPSTSSGSASNSTSGTTSGAPADALSSNGVLIGMLPDGGSDGGSQDTMATLNNLISSTNSKHAFFGQYAQATGSNWAGGQLTQVMNDLKSSGAIFQPAVMPTGGWNGLTSSDNSLALDICNVMKQFTDEGIEVWLRFAHEVNWYQTDGTYQGGASDFKEGWATVAAACKQVAPAVKMFFTPNVADLSTYEQFYPDDPSTVDIIGVDFYPNQGSDLSSAFETAMKPFHDQYCSSSTAFAIGETGLGYAGSADERVQWMQSITASRTNMQYMTGVSWFNYQKGYNFKIVDPNDSSTTQTFVSWVSSSGGNNSSSS